MWIRELDEFEEEYDKWIIDITKSEEKENKKKKVQKLYSLEIFLVI